MGLFLKRFKHREHALIVCLDEGRYLLSLSSEQGGESTFRLNKLYFAIFSILFQEHPHIITYETLKEFLNSQNIALLDVTRLHRKISELRVQLKAFNPIFEDFIQNLRDIGYHLPSSWEEIKPSQEKTVKKKEQKPTRAPLERNVFPELIEKSVPIGGHSHRPHTDLLDFSKLMAKSICLTRQGHLTSVQHYCMIARAPFSEDLQHIESDFLTTRKRLLKNLDLDARDVFHIRLQAFLANFYTYISLSRLCEYIIPHDQWCLWFETEVQQAYEKIEQTLTDIEAEYGRGPREAFSREDYRITL
jgi:DNA-binding winged helix-turn-helix (wHTH) protein